jgi:hypothetical protein
MIYKLYFFNLKHLENTLSIDEAEQLDVDRYYYNAILISIIICYCCFDPHLGQNFDPAFRRYLQL